MVTTIFKQWSGDAWRYWHYADGARVSLSLSRYELMVGQGAKTVTVR